MFLKILEVFSTEEVFVPAHPNWDISNHNYSTAL